MEIQFSTFNNSWDNKPKKHTTNLETFTAGMLLPVVNEYVYEKKRLKMWSPTVFEGGTRSRANAKFISCLVFDIDDGKTPFTTWKLFCKWKVLAHTSFSNKPHHNKYRIILPLGTPIPAQDWGRASIAAVDLWNEVVGIGEPDSKALKDSARCYYRFAIPGGKEYDTEHPLHTENTQHVGKWLAGESLVLKYSHIEVPSKSSPSITTPNYNKKTLSVLFEDKRVREEIASRTNGRIVNNNVRYILCPKCKRNSVFFSIDLSLPESVKFPRCNHIGANGCNWWGTFDELVGEL